MSNWVADVRRLIASSNCNETPNEELEKRILDLVGGIDNEEIVKYLDQYSREISFVLISKIRSNDYPHDLYFRSLIESIKLPSIDWIWYSEVETEFPEGQTGFRSKIDYKLDALEYLLRASTQLVFSEDEIYSSILSLSFYCLPGTPWSGPNTTTKADESMKLLLAQKDANATLQLLGDILNKYIRRQLDILSETKSVSDQKVTKLGYRKLGSDLSEKFKGISPLLGNQASSRMNAQDNWRINNIGSISVFYSIVRFLECLKEKSKDNEDAVSAFFISNWGTIIPFLLNTLENSEGMIKLKGSQTLQCILNIIDPEPGSNSSTRDYFEKRAGEKNILLKTDIGGLLESNIIPCLLSLPSYTPAKKSVLMLEGTYPTLLHLYQLTSTNFRQYCEKVTELIDKYLVSSFVKVKDFPGLVTLLFHIVRVNIVPTLDTYFIVVANKLIYPVLDILIDPFVIYSPDIVVNGLELILDMINKLDQNERQNKYRYDIIAATSLIQKRLFRYEVTTREDEINELTTDIIKRLSKGLDDSEKAKLHSLLAGEQ